MCLSQVSTNESVSYVFESTREPETNRIER